MSSARAGRARRTFGVVVIVVVIVVGILPACADDRRPHSARASTADARRVVSLVPAATALLVAMGVGDRLVGRAFDDPTPGAAHLPTVGTVLAPAVERLALLDPDLILVPAGAHRPSPWPSPSLEVLAERRPDVWLWSATDAPGLGGLWRAVPGARLHRLDPDLFHQPGPGVVEAAGRLAHLLHAGPPSPDLPPSTRHHP